MSLVFGQKPLRFKEFANILLAHRERNRGKRFMWNEVVFPNWSGVDATVPLVAFFGANDRASLNAAVRQRDAFASETGQHLPVVSFDATREFAYEHYA